VSSQTQGGQSKESGLKSNVDGNWLKQTRKKGRGGICGINRGKGSKEKAMKEEKGGKKNTLRTLYGLGFPLPF
jgi:hypothetical protein